MSRVTLRQPTLTDGTRLVLANQESRDHHFPWVEPFTDEEGFQLWLERAQSDASPGFVAIDPARDAIIGIVNLNNIIRGAFHNAFLGFYGMASECRKV